MARGVSYGSVKRTSIKIPQNTVVRGGELSVPSLDTPVVDTVVPGKTRRHALLFLKNVAATSSSYPNTGIVFDPQAFRRAPAFSPFHGVRGGDPEEPP